MSYRNASQSGFTIAELTVVLVLVAIVTTIAYTTFNTSIGEYLGLQKNSLQFSELARSSQRIANVLRGTTDIISASANDISVYAYFSPNNTYVSQIHYYLSADSTILYADVTPMTANPPTGTPITASKKTYTVIGNFYQVAGVNLFTYLDASGNAMALPVSDEHIIKGIKVNLAVPADRPTQGGNQAVTLQVSLRNRKTNL